MACLLLLAAFAALNVLAYRHARAMTHFTEDGWVRKEGGGWAGKPESLSFADKAGVLLNGVSIRRPSDPRRPSDVGLDYSTLSFPGDAGPLEAWHVPHARARGLAVLFHGYTGCKGRLLPEARALHDLGYACLLVDFRGSGGSGGNVTTVGYREADDVARAVAHVRATWPGQPVVLFGQSMGSAAVLRALAEVGVEADAAVLECPFDRMLTTVRARFRAMGVPSFPSAQLLMFWGGVQHGFNAFRHQPVEYARAVKCPVLLLHGEHDRRVSVAQVEEIHANLAGRKALHVFAGLGHESYVGRRADEWKGVVREFLASSSAPDATTTAAASSSHTGK
jgi:alpha-beta hydrolase superfamily lysophospholipase